MKYNNSIHYKAKSQYYNVADAPVFFIVGRCNCGSRHYSEYMNYETALVNMSKYIGVVEYFGGGTVELLDFNGNTLKIKCV